MQYVSATINHIDVNDTGIFEGRLLTKKRNRNSASSQAIMPMTPTIAALAGPINVMTVIVEIRVVRLTALPIQINRVVRFFIKMPQ